MRKILLGLTLLLAGTAHAVTANSIVTAQTPNIGKTQFLNGTDTAGTYKTVYTGASAGSKILGIYVTNEDSVSHLVTVQVSSSTSAHCSPATSCFGGVAVTVPANSGFATVTPAVNAFAPTNWPGLPMDSDGNPYFFLPANTYTVEATFATALSSSTWLNVVVVAADF